VQWVLTALMIPLTLFFLNQQFQNGQTERQESDARLRLYTELLSKREEADTSLRKGVFDKVLDIYLRQTQDTDQKLAGLELLTANFNDSLDLGPLFWQLFREIQETTPIARRPLLLERLTRISNDIKSRQIDLLSVYGKTADEDFTTDVLREANVPFKMETPIDQDLTFDDPEADPSQRSQSRHFRVNPLEFDEKNRRVYCAIEYNKPYSKLEKTAFWVDEFDFPLANFSRISKSERFALVMRRFQPPLVGLTLIYFPSSRSGVKDKPFIDEVISNLTTHDDKTREKK
jgi:hypothetical protein